MNTEEYYTPLEIADVQYMFSDSRLGFLHNMKIYLPNIYVLLAIIQHSDLLSYAIGDLHVLPTTICSFEEIILSPETLQFISIFSTLGIIHITWGAILITFGDDNMKLEHILAYGYVRKSTSYLAWQATSWAGQVNDLTATEEPTHLEF